MKSLNRVQLMGSLGNDPKIFTTPSGSLVARFSIATNIIYKDKKDNVVKTKTDWHVIVLHSYLAELAERLLEKGTRVYVEGALKTREYEDKEKQIRQITEIVGTELIILSNGKTQEKSEKVEGIIKINYQQKEQV